MILKRCACTTCEHCKRIFALVLLRPSPYQTVFKVMQIRVLVSSALSIIKHLCPLPQSLANSFSSLETVKNCMPFSNLIEQHIFTEAVSQSHTVGRKTLPHKMFLVEARPNIKHNN